LPLEQRRRQLQSDWSRLLGNVEPPAEIKSRSVGTTQTLESVAADVRRLTSKLETDGASLPRLLQEGKNSARKISIERVVLTIEPSIVVPLLLLKPSNVDADRQSGKPPVVVAVAQAGKQNFLRARATDIAALLESGAAVCLPDVRGTGETGSGNSRGRRSAVTSLSSSELMLGSTVLGAQLRDFRAVIAWLRTRDDLDARQLGLWGDSLTHPIHRTRIFKFPGMMTTRSRARLNRWADCWHCLLRFTRKTFEPFTCMVDWPASSRCSRNISPCSRTMPWCPARSPPAICAMYLPRSRRAAFVQKEWSMAGTARFRRLISRARTNPPHRATALLTLLRGSRSARSEHLVFNG
jgi:hypothetical protein